MINLKSIISLANNEDIVKWSLVVLAYTVFSAIVDLLLYSQLFSVKINKKQILYFILTYLFTRYFLTIFFPPMTYGIVNIIITVLAYKIILKQSMDKALFGEVCNSLTIITVEALLIKIFCFAFPCIESYNEGIYSLKFFHTLTISIIIIRTYIIILIKRFNIYLDIATKLSYRNKINIIILAIAGCGIIFFDYIQIINNINKSEYYFFLVEIISIDIFFYISLKNILRMNKIERNGMRIECLEKYNKTLGIMYDNIRGFRHDYSNMLLSLEGYVENNNIDGIKKMVESAINECVDTTQMGIFDPKVIDNPAAYSLLTNKFYKAKLKGVFLHVDILLSLKGSDIYNYEMSKILGILLDNAIEAAEKCEIKEVNIIFKKAPNKKDAIIRIENTYSNIDVDINQIFEKGYSTKKENENHGLGLWNVKKILKRTNNLKLSTYKNELFIQELEIKL